MTTDVVRLPTRPQRTPPGERIDAYLDAAHGAFSRNTVRALRADLAVFASWCRANGAVTLPASPQTIATFVRAMAAVRTPATVRRYVASIGAAHRAIDRGAVLESPDGKLALKRMHRQHGRRQQQVLGLTWPLRQRLIAVPAERLIDVRNRAIVAVAYDAMLRRVELTALAVHDLAVEVDGGATLLVRRGKTDSEGHGDVVYLAPDTVAIVSNWLARSGIVDRRLFRSVTKGGCIGQRLHPSQIPRIVKAMARRAGLPPDVVASLSGHSARIGAVQDMIACGIELPAILQAGRWKSTAMVNRYGERLLARRSGAAQLARIQGRAFAGDGPVPGEGSA